MRNLAWGAKVSGPFREKVCEISAILRVDPDWIMSSIAFESGRTFAADVRNAAGSGAVGLIQFMPSTAAALGTSVEALAAMDPVFQLRYVMMYFKPYAGRMQNLGDVYSAIIWPGAIGKPDDFVLFRKDDPNHPALYLQNRGLDINRDGIITRAEIYAKVADMMAVGQQADNIAVIE